MKEDWRLSNQMNYLYRKTLIKMEYPSFGLSGHDHCEFCWDKFGSGGILTEGYCTEDKYRWICNQCFEDFREIFEWVVADR